MRLPGEQLPAWIWRGWDLTGRLPGAKGSRQLANPRDIPHPIAAREGATPKSDNVTFALPGVGIQLGFSRKSHYL